MVARAHHRHRRHHRDQKAAAIQAALREPQLGLPAPTAAAYGSAATALAKLLITLNEHLRRANSWPSLGRKLSADALALRAGALGVV
ncbi:hypothetical protein ACFW6F_41105 [Streptomyces sp. NPDC058746]|uniref:hypothetical protein n=1 Tax=Streptomyces sp. NPDC058746 TaxID=3346622 RepID=UPI0036A44F85